MVDAAELFEAISHPERIKILRILEKEPTSFASLKRQLGIRSSGNLDHHLKKLGDLVKVREDGLYCLTDAGKQALLSIDDAEEWAQTKKQRARKLSEMPIEALALGLLEICSSAALIVWFFVPQMQLSYSLDNLWGLIFFVALLLIGFGSGIDVFLRMRWSWTLVLAKSAIIASMSLFLLDYAIKQGVITQPSYLALPYLAFVAAEAAVVFLALKPSLKEYLGIATSVKLRNRDIVGSVLCVTGGVLLILLESIDRFLIRPGSLSMLPSSVNTVFASISDSSILCGLLILAGGVLILLRSRILGPAISIIFGLFPTPLPGFNPSFLPQQYTYHAYELIVAINSSPLFYLMGAVAYALPIVGGLLALSRLIRIRI